MQWGDVGTWVAGIATGGAFIVTSAVFTMQLRDRRREDARQVSAWISSRETRLQPTDFEVKCRNGSPEPIYDVMITAGAFHPPRGVKVNVVGPLKTATVSIRAPINHDPPIHLRFTDSAGRRWGRHENGRLVKIGRFRREPTVLDSNGRKGDRSDCPGGC